MDSTAAGASLQVTATGLASGDVAQATFTDSAVPAPTSLTAGVQSITPQQVKLTWQNQAGPGGQLIVCIEKILTSQLNEQDPPWVPVGSTAAGPNNSYQSYTDGVDNAWVSINGDTNPLDYSYRIYVVRYVNGQVSGRSTFTSAESALPIMTVNDVREFEGDSGTTAFEFTVSLSVAGVQPATVNYSTANDSATDGSDYTATSGALTFNPGETSKTVIVLVNGDTTYEADETFFVNLTDPVNVTLSDAQGLGTIRNDDGSRPVLTNPGNQTVAELGTLNFTLSATDPNPDAYPLTYTITSVLQSGVPLDPTALGMTLGSSTGAFSWAPTESQDGAYTVTFRVTNQNGYYSEQTITITVNEMNQAPTLSGVPSEETIPEEATYTFTATAMDGDSVNGAPNALTFSLLNAPDGATITTAQPGVTVVTTQTGGTATGAFSWAPTESQGPGDYTFTVRVSDGITSTDQSVTLHVTEVNKPPVAMTDSYAVDEGGTLSVTDPALGVLANDSDADIVNGLPNSLHAVLVSGPAHATAFALDDNGTFTYTHDGGESTSDSFSYKVFDGTADGNTVVVNITINPVNDAPVAYDTLLKKVVEDTPTGGQLGASDVDSPTLTYSIVGGPSNGAVVINDIHTGDYTYTPNLNYNGSDSFTFKVYDGQAYSNEATVNILVAAQNDPAVIGGTDSGSVTENVDPGIASGTLTISDADAGEDVFRTPNQLVGKYGTFTFDPTGENKGQWAYTLDNSKSVVQALADGETVQDRLTVESYDGTTHDIVVTIHGTNDAAVIGGKLAGSVTEDGTLTDNGTLTIQDVDAPPTQESFQAASGASDGKFGTFTIDSVGNWTYALDNGNAVAQALPLGATLADSFTVKSYDGTEQVISITIHGTNDPAAIGGTAAGSVTEDVAPGTASGVLIVTDVDTGENKFSEQTNVATAHGTFSINQAGTWVYTLNNDDPAVQALPAGVTLTDKFTVTSLDKTASKDVTITITGANDTPVISGQTSGSVKEHDTLQVGGVLMIQDTDTGESSFKGDTITVSYGTFTIDSGGTWIFDLNNDNPTVQALAQGTSMGVAFPATSYDGMVTQLVTITINGNNDKATISGTTIGSVKEDAIGTASGKLTVVDVDTGENSFQVASGASDGKFGTFTIDADGNWVYTLDNNKPAVQALPEGAVQSDSFTVQSFDGTAKVITIGIEGTNDAPTLNPIGAKSVGEGAALNFTVSGSDVDGNTLTYSATGLPIGATLNSTTGVFAWTPTEAQEGTYNVTFAVSDGTVSASEAVTISVNEVNQPPALSFIPNQVVIAGAVVAFVAVGSDPDVIGGVPQSLNYSLVSAPAGATLNPTTGAFSWATTGVAPGTYPVTVQVTDSDGLSASQSLTIAVNPEVPLVFRAVGTGPGTGAQVLVYNAASGAEVHRMSFPGFTAGVTVATGDVTGDGIPDIIVGAATGSSLVGVWDGATGAFIAGGYAFGPGYTGGVTVAAGDLTGDGRADVIVGAADGGSLVGFFDAATGAAAYVPVFGPGYTGGVTVGAGDVTGDGRAEVVVGAVTGSSLVGMFDPATGAAAYNYAFDGIPVGVSVAAGAGKVVTGVYPGPLSKPYVAEYSGFAWELDRAFWAFDPMSAGGVYVG